MKTNAVRCEASLKVVPALDSPLRVFCFVRRCSSDWFERTDPSVGMYFHLCARTSFHWTEKERNFYIREHAKKQVFESSRREVCSAIVFWWERLLFWITRQHFNSVSHVSLTQGNLKSNSLTPQHSVCVLEPWTQFFLGDERRIFASSKINSFPRNADKMLQSGCGLVTNYFWCTLAFEFTGIPDFRVRT